jgi:hypothetical protein
VQFDVLRVVLEVNLEGFVVLHFYIYIRVG